MACNENEYYIRIQHFGVYILRYFIIYTKPTGEDVTKTGIMLIHDINQISYPSNATKIRVIIQSAYFIESYKTFFDKTYTTLGKHCFQTKGTSLNPYLTEVPCPFDTYMRVTNSGFFVSRFFVIYKTTDGRETTLDSGDMLANETITLSYPPNIEYVRLKINIAVFIATYKTYFDVTFSSASQRCYNVYGSLFKVYIDEIQCT